MVSALSISTFCQILPRNKSWWCKNEHMHLYEGSIYAYVLIFYNILYMYICVCACVCMCVGVYIVYMLPRSIKPDATAWPHLRQLLLLRRYRLREEFNGPIFWPSKIGGYFLDPLWWRKNFGGWDGIIWMLRPAFFFCMIRSVQLSWFCWCCFHCSFFASLANSDCRARVPVFFSMMEFLQAIRWHPQVYGMSARQITAILPPEHEHWTWKS